MTCDHTQKSPLYLILLFPAILLVVTALIAPPPLPLFALLACGAAALIFVAFSFKYLRVRDEGDCLAVRFGPLPIFRCRILYSQITGACLGLMTTWNLSVEPWSHGERRDRTCWKAGMIWPSCGTCVFAWSVGGGNRAAADGASGVWGEAPTVPLLEDRDAEHQRASLPVLCGLRVSAGRSSPRSVCRPAG